MERIQNILQRLQEVYYGKHQKSAIDVDLMLDYTRVMYADLLEWRKQFKEPNTTETAEPNTNVVTSEAEKEDNNKQPETNATAASVASTSEAPAEEDGARKEVQEVDNQEDEAPEDDAPEAEIPEAEAKESTEDKASADTSEAPPAAEDEVPEKEDEGPEKEDEEPEVETAVQKEEEDAPDEEQDGAPAETKDEAAAEDAPADDVKKEESKGEVAADKKEASAAGQPAGYKPIERDEPAVKAPLAETSEPLVVTHPDKEQVEVLMNDATGISFEPPTRQELKSEVKEDMMVEEPTTNQPVAEIPAPSPVEIPLPDIKAPRPQQPEPAPQAPRQPEAPKQAAGPKPPDLFQAAKVANKDVRSSIGINDKYLFLNELFNNHKSNYEETLDKLNHFSTREQAEDWIRTKVAPAQKWDDRDATVQGFYGMLAKHFSSR